MHARVPKAHVDGKTGAVTSPTFFVSPNGDDSAAGTESHPFQTLHRAQVAVRALSSGDRPGTTVNIMAGTYSLGNPASDGSLVFTSDDSGIAGSPVTWQAYPVGAKVIVSGGRQLECAWTKTTLNGVSVQKCAVPVGLTADTLFIGGVRQVRARYPNGNPLVPKDGYSTGCKTASTWPITSKKYPMNWQVLSPNGTVISTGSVPGAVNGSVTVHDILEPRGVVTTPQAYHSTRFNETFNKPYWDTTSPNAIHVPPDWVGRHWSNPNGAIVKMMHPAGWGSWAFLTESFDGDILNFSKGGFQVVPPPRVSASAMHVLSCCARVMVKPRRLMDRRTILRRPEETRDAAQHTLKT